MKHHLFIFNFKKMKKLIKNILYFIPFLFIVYVLNIILWAEVAHPLFKKNLNYKIGSYGHMYSRILDIKNYNNVDILFLGSSHAYRGFDTRIFKKNNLKAFNLGSSGQTAAQTKVLLNRYLDHLNPKLVIYEVYPSFLTGDGVESSLDIIANDKIDFNSLLMALEINNIKTYNALIYGYYKEIIGSKRNYIEHKIINDDEYVPGGYVERKIKYFDKKKLKQKKIKLIDYQMESFNEIVDLLKEDNIELLLVYAPVTHVDYNRYENNNFYDSLMYKKAKYYNFNRLMNLDDSKHFYDSHHLNQRGVKVFNNEVIRLLKKEIIK